MFFFLRAEGCSCSSDVLYIGLAKGITIFYLKKYNFFFYCNFAFLFWSSNPLDPNPDWYTASWIRIRTQIPRIHNTASHSVKDIITERSTQNLRETGHRGCFCPIGHWQTEWRIFFFVYLELRVHTEWQRPLSGVHSIMMEISSGWWGGGGALHALTAFYYIYHHVQLQCSCSVRYAPAEWADIFTQSLPIYVLCGLECVGYSFAYVAHFVFLRDVWIRNQRAAVASRRATNWATHWRTIW